uniref:Metalloendopeptidase n=1 Tax=Romanomermis culicivorax TaxID=13658 RepID=A0A915J5L4_ROMCU
MKLSQVVWSSQSDNQEPTYPRFRRKLDNRRRTLKGRLWSNGDHKRSAIEKAIEHWRENTCLKFRNSNRKDYILFEDGVVCRSSVGRQGGMQTIDLADGCENLGIGIKGGGGDNGNNIICSSNNSRYSSSSSSSSKKVISFMKSAIRLAAGMKDDWYQYRVIESDEDYLAAQLTPYDYGSVMHYYVEGLSPKNKEIPTIETIDPNYMQTIGQRAGLSFLDIKRVNEAYCSGNCGAELKATAIWKTIPKSATNQDCNWLIKASPGQNVRLEISISGFDCGDGPCSNYVEVKYKIGFESTGARLPISDFTNLLLSFICMELVERSRSKKIFGLPNAVVTEFQPLSTSLYDSSFTTSLIAINLFLDIQHLEMIRSHFRKNSYEEVSCNRNVCLGAASNGGRGWYCCRGYELREGVCQPISKV